MIKKTGNVMAVEEQVAAFTLDELRQLMGVIIQKNPNSGRFWDILTCLRGPDSPSERGDMDSAEASRAYQGRRDRKFKTVEVIRQKAFFGIIGGAARHHDSEKVILPPSGSWDHFDKHVARAAGALGLKVEVEK